MKVNFQIAGVQLKESEATTLCTLSDSLPSVTVDLMDHVDSSLLDCTKLFKLSIEKKHPELAALAAKLAMATPSSTKKVKVSSKKKNRQTISGIQVKKVSLDVALEELLVARNIRSAGAAMILSELARHSDLTLRSIAVKQVNSLAGVGLAKNSDLFKGFKKVKSKYSPFVAKAQKGVMTYHSSPIYGAMRDGLAYLVERGLVKVSEETTYGSTDKKLNETQSFLQRKVYILNLTEQGEVLVDTWADVDEFILKFWEGRVA